MSSSFDIDSMQRVLGLLDDEIDDAEFAAVIAELEASPGLMEALVTVQFVKDALAGNASPDRHYTARIMQFIAASESVRNGDEA